MPLFPFGYGLSYTTFRLGGLKVDGTGEQRTVRVRVTNIGKRVGAEVAQLYVGFPAAAREPPKQLKGFDKVLLEPGESRVVTMALGQASLSAWDEGSHRWKVYPGTYTVSVGSSSRNLPLRATFEVAER